jgi:hypothetical protein
MFVIFYSPAAKLEISESFDWYELQQQGLGDQFIDELEKIEYYIGLNPTLFPKKYSSVRKRLLKGFLT